MNAEQYPSLDVEIKVEYGKDLPKMDTFGKIDGYVKVFTDNNVKACGKTQVQKKDYNPTWNSIISACCNQNSKIKFEVWDHDSTSDDDKVGEVTVDFSVLLNGTTVVDMSLEPSVKKKTNAKLGVSARIVGKSFYGHCFELINTNPAAFFNLAQKRIYFPLPNFPHIICCLERESSNELDIKLYSVLEPVDGTKIYLDIIVNQEGKNKTKIRRRSFPNGHRLEIDFPAKGQLIVYEEVKINNLKLKGTDWSQIQIMGFMAQQIAKTDVAEVVENHGWVGMLNYPAARKTLKDCKFDDDDMAVYMPFGDEKDAVFVVDYDDTDVDIKVAILDTLDATAKCFDLSLDIDQEIKKQSAFYGTAIQPKGEASCYNIRRILKLDDIPSGTTFKTMTITTYALTGSVSWTLNQLLVWDFGL